MKNCLVASAITKHERAVNVKCDQNLRLQCGLYLLLAVNTKMHFSNASVSLTVQSESRTLHTQTDVRFLGFNDRGDLNNIQLPNILVLLK